MRCCEFIQSTQFSVVVGINKIHIFDQVFFLLAIVLMITAKMCFCCFHGSHCYGNKFLHRETNHNHEAYSLKRGVKWIKTTKKLFVKVYLLPIAEDSDLKNGVRMEQTLNFWSFTTNCNAPGRI